MADIPQEVRAATEGAIEALLAHYPNMAGASLERSREGFQRMYLAMFLAGKRAGMERAAEIAVGLSNSAIFWEVDREATCARIAQAIRSENDGHG